jgi:hypothetical protein
MPRKRPLYDVKPTKRQTERARASIQATKIMQHLQRIALGEIKGDPSQIRAGLGLLAKVMPDLQSTQIEDVTPNHGDPLEVQAQMHELVVGQLMEAGLSREQAEAILQKKPQPEHTTEPATADVVHKSEVARAKHLNS